MSRRYEFLDQQLAELVTTQEGLRDITEEEGETYADDLVFLVIGDPYAAAAVLAGRREDIAADLRRYLRLVELAEGEAECFNCHERIRLEDIDNGKGSVWVDGGNAMYCYDDDSDCQHEPVA